MNEKPDLREPDPFTPPALPGIPKKQDRLAEALESGKDRLEGAINPLAVADGLLKHPERVTGEILTGERRRVVLSLLAVLVIAVMAYGLVMAMFAGGSQLWMVPARLLLVTFLSGLICLPSLYIFAALSGGRQTASEIGGLLIMAITLNGILMIGFAPIAWVFTQSTRSAVFMGTLHLAFWGVGAAFALRLLIGVLTHLNRSQARVVRLWGFLFLVVMLQMTTTFRPLVGAYEGMMPQGRKFFLDHWRDCMNTDSRAIPGDDRRR